MKSTDQSSSKKADKIRCNELKLLSIEFINYKNSFDDNIVMDGEGVLAELDFGKFYECLGGNYEQIMKKNEKSHEVRRF